MPVPSPSFTVAPMPDRLDELRRQRALLEQHLDWLDREIAAETQRATAGTRALPQATEAAAAAPAPSIATSNAVTPEPTTATTVNIVNPVVAAAPSLPAPNVPLIPLEPSALDPETMMSQYRVAPDSLKQDIRKGCLLYFALAFALLGLGVAVLWLAFRK